MPPSSIRKFAAEQVRPTLIERYQRREFSRDLWKKMAQAGLFGLLVPVEYGGSGKDCSRLIEAIEDFVLGGNDLGLCLSWLDHLLIHTHVIDRFGTATQREMFLPGLVRGDRIGAMAASEPGSGANPVKMRSRAEKHNGAYRIDGEKVFITNGPVADFVIVLARTEPGTDKSGLSAFVLDTTTPGFRARAMDLGFLYTSPHGELFLEGCLVPETNLVGALGDGHVRISRAVFAWERFLLIVALGAHFRVLLDRTLQRLAQNVSSGDDKGQKLIASSHVILEGLRESGRNLAREALDQNELDLRMLERLLFLGASYASWWQLVEELLRLYPPEPEPLLTILLRDARLLHVNQRLTNMQFRRVAARLLEEAREHQHQ